MSKKKSLIFFTSHLIVKLKSFHRAIKTQDQLKHVCCRQSQHKSHIFRQITHEQLIALVLIYITHPYGIQPCDCVCVHITAGGFLAANEQTQSEPGAGICSAPRGRSDHVFA